ncbi:hypothetical protein KRR38_33430 [Novosphingobium sp. G106]|uniref:hypothetical protein n=1 Tax=Novosphingobium sp. G106 TaxID=2849500 RepID=UPI001C2D99D0|nr:hypothetical protein [Novosphingobium sp. G106]MBV1692410.1 hypothetical protein [Novosphingobium sp. G106]
MAISITVDNDRNLLGTQQLDLDESASLQTTADANGTATGDKDDDVLATYNSTSNVFASGAGGLDVAFVNYISGLFPDLDPAGQPALDAVRDTALGFVANVGGASSSTSFIQVTATAGETISNLFFSLAPSAPSGAINSVKTRANEDLFFHINADTDFATLTTLGRKDRRRVLPEGKRRPSQRPSANGYVRSAQAHGQQQC